MMAAGGCDKSRKGGSKGGGGGRGGHYLIAYLKNDYGTKLHELRHARCVRVKGFLPACCSLLTCSRRGSTPVPRPCASDADPDPSSLSPPGSTWTTRIDWRWRRHGAPSRRSSGRT